MSRDSIPDDNDTRYLSPKISKVDVTNLSSDDEFSVCENIVEQVKDKAKVKSSSQESKSGKSKTKNKPKPGGGILRFLQVSPKKNTSFTNSLNDDSTSENKSLNKGFRDSDLSVADKNQSFSFRANELSAGLVNFMSKVNLNEIKALMNDSCNFCSTFTKCSCEHLKETTVATEDVSFLDEPFEEPDLSCLKAACDAKIKEYKKSQDEEKNDCNIGDHLECLETFKEPDLSFVKETCDAKIEQDKKSSNGGKSDSKNAGDVETSLLEANVDIIDSSILGNDFEAFNMPNNKKPAKKKSANTYQNQSCVDILPKHEIDDVLSYFNLDNALDLFGESKLSKKNAKTASTLVASPKPKVPKKSLDELKNKSFLTITQMLDVINASDLSDQKSLQNSSLCDQKPLQNSTLPDQKPLQNSTLSDRKSLQNITSSENNDSTFCEEAETDSPANKTMKPKLNLSRLNSLKILKQQPSTSRDLNRSKSESTTLNKSTFFNSVDDDFDDLLDERFKNELFSLIDDKGDSLQAKPNTTSDPKTNVVSPRKDVKDSPSISYADFQYDSDIDDVFEEKSESSPKTSKLDLSNFKYSAKTSAKPNSRIDSRYEENVDLSDVPDLDLSEFQFSCKTSRDSKSSPSILQKDQVIRM